MAPDIRITNSINEETLKQLLAGLQRHSETLSIVREPEPLAALMTDESDQLLAGLWGQTLFGWLNIKYLWVNPELRGQGTGAALVASAEQEALSRNCHSAQVDTHSFQARDFYLKLGYHIFGELEQYPDRHSRIYFRKQLAHS